MYVIGRHRKAPESIPPGMKKQVLLPMYHHVTELLVRHVKLGMDVER